MPLIAEAVAQMAHAYTRAWNAKSPETVASFYAEDGRISIFRGEPWQGRDRVAAMAAGFYADVPDLALRCDEIRLAGTHAVYVGTCTGHDAKTGRPLEVRGWEEWELNDAGEVRASLGWFDADDWRPPGPGRVSA